MLPAPKGDEKTTRKGARAKKPSTAKIDKLLREHPALADIISGKKQIGDGSASDRDHHLCCEAIRRGLDQGDTLERLLRHARAGDEKGERPDYIENTIAAARAAQPPPDDKLTTEQRLAEISAAMSLGTDPVVSGVIHGLDVGSGAGVIVLARKSGAVVRFARYSHLFDLRAYARTVRRYNRGASMDTPTQAAIDRLAGHIIAVCEINEQNPADEARQWLYDFDYELGDTVKIDTDPTWEQLKKARDRAGELTSQAGPKVSAAGKAVALLDPAGNTWIPAGALLAQIPHGARPDAGELRSRMAEAGIERREVDRRASGIPHSQRSAEHRIRGVYYLIPPDPEDHE